ncbi:MAG: hypothetical protein WB586_18305 [Chthoniobacterales bacterium]
MQAALAQIFVLASAATIVSACQAGRPDPDAAAYAAVLSATTGEDLRVTVRDNVPLYSTGPQQFTMPDASLRKGTLVRVVQKQFGFSLVETGDGNQLGWVANDDLAAAPPVTLDQTPSEE